MPKITYSEKLKDPRWQKKRLEILQRDNFSCTLCGDKETTLHVHHNSYEKEPWDSKNEDLITYCEHCHAIIEFNKDFDIKILGNIKVTYDDGVCLMHMIYSNSPKMDNMIVDVYKYEGSKLKYLVTIYDDTLRILSNGLASLDKSKSNG